MNLYNPNVEMFTSVTFLAEFLSTGGVFPTSHFEPINFQGQSFIYLQSVPNSCFTGFPSIFELISAILYIAFIIHFMICEIRSLIHLKLAYFRQFWSFIEWEIIGCSWSDVDPMNSHELDVSLKKQMVIVILIFNL